MMLILIFTLHIVEAINIGNDISVRVLDMQNSQVRIGINARQEVPVHREEIFHRLEQHRLDTAVDEDARCNV
jgi:carbon storage regulator